MTQDPTKRKAFTAGERAFERIDVRKELRVLEERIEALKVDYEQFFMGIVHIAPDKQHQDVKRLIRRLRKAPFKNSQMNFQLRTIEGKYQTYNNYWQRVLREREEGTYSRDVFKADLRQRVAREEAEAQTARGQASKSMRDLYDSYKQALEKNTGRQQNVDFSAFQKSLINRAKDFKKKNKDKKLTFKVVTKNGKVTVQAKVKKA